MFAASHFHIKRRTFYQFMGDGEFAGSTPPEDGETVIVVPSVHEVNKFVCYRQGEFYFKKTTSEVTATAQWSVKENKFDKLILYKGEDGVLWVRPADEFNDVDRYAPLHHLILDALAASKTVADDLETFKSRLYDLGTIPSY